MTRPRTRLYLLTPPIVADVDAFAAALTAALDAGDVACLQIRLKDPETNAPAPDDEILRLGEKIVPLAQGYDVAVLINDRPDLAVALNADGVHIGQDDIPYKQAREAVGPDRIVGVTCHASRHLAMVAAEQGADYVAFGAFSQTQTKTPKSSADPSILTWWQEMMEAPCVAIGGIGVNDARPLATAGADFLAVSSGVWAHSGGAAAAVAKFNAELDATFARWSDPSTSG